MDIPHINQLISDLRIDDPVLEDTEFEVGELPYSDGKWLGAFYPDKNLIVISPEAGENVVLHELGHKLCYTHFGDLSERGAEMFRRYIMGE